MAGHQAGETIDLGVVPTEFPAFTEHLKIWKGTLSLITGFNDKQLYP